MNKNVNKVRWAVVLLSPNMDHQVWKHTVISDVHKQDTWLKLNDQVMIFSTRKAAEAAGKVARDGMYHWRVQKYVKRKTIA